MPRPLNSSYKALYQRSIEIANSGKPIVRQQGKAYMFSSPAVAGDVVFIGVLNGTLEARDAKTGDLLWDFQVEKSKQNNGWVLTGDRKFNVPFLYPLQLA